MIVVVDYGMGNLKSVENAAKVLGKRVKITDSKELIKKAKKIIFPGVGHFGKTVKELKKKKIFDPIKAKILEGTPFLGICIGMQILFEESQEAPGVKGLGIIKGKVKKFNEDKLVVPHMGWNRIEYKDNINKDGRKIFKGIKGLSFFYFVHSYYCEPKNKQDILTVTDYGVKFASSVYRNNIWALQFHAEKSQAKGLKVFNNFLELC